MSELHDVLASGADGLDFFTTYLPLANEVRDTGHTVEELTKLYWRESELDVTVLRTDGLTWSNAAALVREPVAQAVAQRDDVQHLWIGVGANAAIPAVGALLTSMEATRAAMEEAGQGYAAAVESIRTITAEKAKVVGGWDRDPFRLSPSDMSDLKSVLSGLRGSMPILSRIGTMSVGMYLHNSFWPAVMERCTTFTELSATTTDHITQVLAELARHCAESAIPDPGRVPQLREFEDPARQQGRTGQGNGGHHQQDPGGQGSGGQSGGGQGSGGQTGGGQGGVARTPIPPSDMMSTMPQAVGAQGPWLPGTVDPGTVMPGAIDPDRFDPDTAGLPGQGQFRPGQFEQGVAAASTPTGVGISGLVDAVTKLATAVTEAVTDVVQDFTDHLAAESAENGAENDAEDEPADDAGEKADCPNEDKANADKANAEGKPPTETTETTETAETTETTETTEDQPRDHESGQVSDEKPTDLDPTDPDPADPSKDTDGPTDSPHTQLTNSEPAGAEPAVNEQPAMPPQATELTSGPTADSPTSSPPQQVPPAQCSVPTTDGVILAEVGG